MIVSALVKRYEETQDVPIGWQKREVSYALDLSKDGKLLDIIQLGDHSGKKRGRLPLTLPSIGSGRQGKKAYEIAYFLCDDGCYMLGLDSKKFESARKLHISLLKDIDTPAANAIRAYFASSIPVHPPGNDEKIDATAKYIFSINGKRVDYDDGGVEIRSLWEASQINDGEQICCLVSGKRDTIIKLHDKVALRGVTMGAQPLISMNDQTSFRSYGEKPSDPPVRMGQYAAFAYATALNALLKDKRHHKFIGGDTLAYWAEKGGAAEEELFANLLAPPKVDEDKNLADAIAKIVRGDKVFDYKPERKFYLLCLSPNAARISVRFFYESAFGDLISNISAHYKRLEITGDGRTPFDFLPLWLILSETTVKESAGDASPLLGGQILRSILTNAEYPLTLYNAMLTRIRAGRPINKTKAAVFKAALIKNFNEKEVATVALNEQSEKKPYVLGRLFSVLERLQERANGSATIRERYFTSACANPGSVFPTLLNLSMHHAAKLDSAVFYEKLKGELLTRLDDETPFPATFSLDDQGRFILGYYHQTQWFFTKKKTGEDSSNEQ